jgi:hypothetical protein
MAKALKTQKTAASVSSFIDGINDERRRRDARTVSAIMEDITGEKPAMWGSSIVGFGSYHYKYASGQQGDWPITAFSPRKDNLTLYLLPGFQGKRELLGKLGKHSTGVSCLYIKSLDEVHMPTLKALVRQSVKDLKKMVKERGSWTYERGTKGNAKPSKK